MVACGAALALVGIYLAVRGSLAFGILDLVTGALLSTRGIFAIVGVGSTSR